MDAAAIKFSLLKQHGEVACEATFFCKASDRRM